MTSHSARVVWEPRELKHSDPSYSRAHVWEFDGGVRVQASASPQRVRVPLAMEAAVDPEEAFVAAIASCHMLWFLDFAQRAKLEVARYCDDASGIMARDERGRWAFREVVLQPMIAWADRTPSRAELEALHHQSHEACFLANSVRCEVRVVF